MEKDVTKMTLEELKAAAYDQLVALQIAQNNLNILNQRIANFPKEEKASEKK
jgi:hypothetical protein